MDSSTIPYWTSLQAVSSLLFTKSVLSHVLLVSHWTRKRCTVSKKRTILFLNYTKSWPDLKSLTLKSILTRSIWLEYQAEILVIQVTWAIVRRVSVLHYNPITKWYLVERVMVRFERGLCVKQSLIAFLVKNLARAWLVRCISTQVLVCSLSRVARQSFLDNKPDPCVPLLKNMHEVNLVQVVGRYSSGEWHGRITVNKLFGITQCSTWQ